MKESPSEILRAAKELLTDPARWVRFHFAETKDGRGTSSDSKNAICWCSIGAVLKVEKDRGINTEGMDHWFNDPPLKLLKKAANAYASKYLRGQMGDDFTYDRAVGYYNDFVFTHYDVIQMFDAAIKLADEQETAGE
jgi:hypothetical protein